MKPDLNPNEQLLQDMMAEGCEVETRGPLGQSGRAITTSLTAACAFVGTLSTSVWLTDYPDHDRAHAKGEGLARAVIKSIENAHPVAGQVIDSIRSANPFRHLEPKNVEFPSARAEEAKPSTNPFASARQGKRESRKSTPAYDNDDPSPG